ncbi:Uncharacterised protein [Klebsiella quasipneumoniae]|nr:Uncharacterised protein [Klebsiella quasipneumoniae]
MINYDQIRAEYRAKYRAYKLELIDELSAQRDALNFTFSDLLKEGANKQVISSQADSLIKISRIWADFFPANTSNQPI